MKGPVRLPGLNSRMVFELDRGRSRELLLAVGLSAVMLMPLLVYVWQNVEWFRSGYRIEELKVRRERLAETNRRLRLEKVSLEDLTRVERVAAAQLGLKEPPGGTVVLVDRGRLAPVPTPPSASIASGTTLKPGPGHTPEAPGHDRH
ncbi:MAG TPA: cell division protein FtsL [Candidatus Polarisedimenticolia bacterium]|nr:cell division protein FtsL [Candidatus Polarisedimenticolia bacterium]